MQTSPGRLCNCETTIDLELRSLLSNLEDLLVGEPVDVLCDDSGDAVVLPEPECVHRCQPGHLERADVAAHQADVAAGDARVVQQRQVAAHLRSLGGAQLAADASPQQARHGRVGRVTNRFKAFCKEFI